MPFPFPSLPPAQRGTVHTLRHHSTVLADNPHGDPVDRDVIVYTPPGDHGPLPAIAILPAFAGTGEGLLGRGLGDLPISTRIDRLIAAGCPPFIAVLPDVMTSLGGGQYVDSPGMGRYASYVVDEILPFVADHFPVNGRWGTVGRSSGGFGGLHLAMRRPGTFQAVACLAGDMGFDLCYLGDLGPAIRGVRRAGGLANFISYFWEQNRPNHDLFAAFNILAMSCVYSPDPDASPLPARFPVDFETGAVDFDVLASWRDYDPLIEVERAERRAGLAALDTLFLDAGRHDEYHLQLGARRFVAALERHGVPVTYEEFDGGHRGTAYRYDRAIPEIARALSTP